ncbi:MAG TPA: M23 family metallopeptidase [Oligoflexia bacterium]|nr:M23 family metallopeptidase [Oligoflexia bacterium]HMR25698.1 M23 family metallopeptidase [Oligoflexia bacterium]
MKKKKKSTVFTFMFIPERHWGVKKWIVSRKWLKNAAIALSCFAFLSALSITYSVRNLAKSFSQVKSEDRIELLENKIRVLKTELYEAQATLARLDTFEQKLRTMARIEKSNLAIGPLTVEEQNIIDHKQEMPLDFSQVGEINDDDFNALEMTAKNIQRKANIREQSLQHLYELLRDQSSLIAATPSIWPVRGWVSSHYGKRISPFTGQVKHHYGVDIPAPTGTKVMAAADGVVIKVGTDGGYGKMISIRHGYGMVTRYGHNSKNLVQVGQKVKRGEVIAEVGSTGRSTGPHLHYEVRINGVPVNPAKYMVD